MRIYMVQMMKWCMHIYITLLITASTSFYHVQRATVVMTNITFARSSHLHVTPPPPPPPPQPLYGVSY